MSGCTSTSKYLDFRYSAKIWGVYTQKSQISTLFIHFSLENLVEILGDCLKLGTLKKKSFRLRYAERLSDFV